MLVKGIIDEDFINYKKPSMTIMCPFCDFKCDKEYGKPICQNSSLAKEPNIKISERKIVERYISNSITEAMVFQGLEPLDSLMNIIYIIEILRLNYNCKDDVVIYTGYNKEEISEDFLHHLKYLGNIIIKYGRFIPGQKHHYDEVLGVKIE